MKKYTTLLFDADNTLLDFDKAERCALQKLLKFYNLPISEENCRAYSQINDGLWKQFERGEIEKAQIKSTRFRKFFEHLKVDTPIDPNEANDRYLSFLREGGYIIDGADELCRILREKGYTLYIITNGIALTQAVRFEKSGLLPYITDVFVSETIGFQKPKKEYFDFVLQNIHEADKSKVLVIGDSLTSDIQGAINSGLDFIWYNHKKADIPESINPSSVINDIKELHGIL